MNNKNGHKTPSKHQLVGRLLRGPQSDQQAPLPEFMQVFKFKRVDCANCKQGAEMPATDLVICRTLQELFDRAKSDHSKIKNATGVICSDPALIIYSEPIFISTKYLMDAQDESIITGK